MTPQQEKLRDITDDEIRSIINKKYPYASQDYDQAKKAIAFAKGIKWYRSELNKKQ